MSDTKEPENAAGETETRKNKETRGEPSREPAAETPQVAPEPAALAEELAKLRAERDDLRQTLIRRQADFENHRKRLERERHEESHRAVARIVDGLLPVLDAFERALAAHDDPAYEDYRKGFELIYRRLWEVLSRQGLSRIEAAGKRFDPHVHQAIERVESEEHEDGTVIEVLQAGYKLRDKLLRPASVRVAVHPSEKDAANYKRVN